MLLRPDLETAVIDPILRPDHPDPDCDVLEPLTASIMRAARAPSPSAEAFVNSSGAATPLLRPGSGILHFRRCALRRGHEQGLLMSTPRKAPTIRHRISRSNLGHRPKVKGGYFPRAPGGQREDMRGRNAGGDARHGITRRAPSRAPVPNMTWLQFNTLNQCGDYMQILQYVTPPGRPGLWQKTATFMPKPVYGDNWALGSMSTSRSGRRQSRCLPVRAMPTCRTPACITSAASSSSQGCSMPSPNPLTKQSQAVDPGFEARPLLRLVRPATLGLAPHSFSASPNGKARYEVRFPDRAANPYSAYAAMLMAGWTGSEKRSIGRPDGQGPSMPCPPKNWRRCRRCAVRCARRWTA